MFRKIQVLINPDVIGNNMKKYILLLLLIGCASPHENIYKGINGLCRIEIDGGYGYLTNLSLDVDGTGCWTGFEPARRTASEKKFKLSNEELKTFHRILSRLDIENLSEAYNLGNKYYVLKITDNKNEKTIEFKKNGEINIPVELSDLVNFIWKTRKK